MATTLTPHQRAMKSTVTKKAIMAVTGLFLILFLLMHMFGNLKLLLPHGREHFVEYSEYLRNFLSPLLPHMWFLWLFRFALVAAFLLHMWSAFSLWARNRRSSGGARYKNYQGPTYVQTIMRWGGVTILLFVIFHILQFTAEVVRVGYWDQTNRAHQDPGLNGHVIDSASRTILGFQNPIIFAVYALAMLAVCLHVWKGFWSAFATLGANVSKGAERVLNVCALLIAAILYIGFMITPLLILTGVVK